MSQVLSSTSIDDGDKNITYVPIGQWTVHTNVNLTFHLYNNTDTFSSVQNAIATLLFYGDAIQYWGNQGPFHGPCAISLDGQEMTTVNSNAPADDVPILLYSKSNLTLGDHSLEIRVVDASFPNVCEVDRFVTNITSVTTSPGNGNVTSSQATSTNGDVVLHTSAGESTRSSGNVAQPTSGGQSISNNGAHTQSKSGTPMAAIIGAAAGGLACIILLGFCLFLRSRKRKTNKRDITISKPFILNDEPSSPVPQTPSFYQTDHDRTSYTASPVDEPMYTPQSARVPAKLMTRPRPAAFDYSPSSAYLQYPQSSHLSSPITEEPPSAIATISPTSAKLDPGYQSVTTPRRYAVNNPGASSFGSERFSDKSAAGRNEIPPPAYDG